MTVTVRRGSNKQEHPRTPSATRKMNKWTNPNRYIEGLVDADNPWILERVRSLLTLNVGVNFFCKPTTESRIKKTNLWMFTLTENEWMMNAWSNPPNQDQMTYRPCQCPLNFKGSLEWARISNKWISSLSRFPNEQLHHYRLKWSYWSLILSHPVSSLLQVVNADVLVSGYTHLQLTRIIVSIYAVLSIAQASTGSSHLVSKFEVKQSVSGFQLWYLTEISSQTTNSRSPGLHTEISLTCPSQCAKRTNIHSLLY